MTEWQGTFHFGDYWAAYRGAAGDNALHSHATLQITLAVAGDLMLEAGDGAAHSGRSLMVRPRTLHRLERHEQVLLLLIEPQTPLCRALLDLMGNADITPLPKNVAAEIDLGAPLHTCLDQISAASPPAPHALDPRLQQAIEHLDSAPEDLPLATVAEHCGLSESRLRALASDELQLPLSKWVLWRKLRRSAEELAAGGDLASAALAGGFADQAHFTRTMKNLIGLTPGMAAEPFR
ncbi:AraC family transcriptional regulator [Parvibaculaceae bacterium PLY_AMNH_Bact1]|nr:AraC family transcriptional regulator [Parvibaculaceae bacterium PLY_AMNH_Bact1]